MAELTDVTEQLTSLREALTTHGADLERYLEAVVDVYEVRIPEENTLNARVAEVGRPGRDTDGVGLEAAGRYNSTQLAARLRRGALLREVGLIASERGAGSTDRLETLVEDTLSLEMNLMEAVDSLERTTVVDGVKVEPALAAGGVSFSAPAVTPGNEVVATVRYRNLGDEDATGITADVTPSDGLSMLDGTLSKRTLAGAEEGRWRGRLRTEGTGLQRLTVTLSAENAAPATVDGTVSIRTAEAAEAHRSRIADGFDPLSDRDDALLAGGGAVGAAGLGAAYYAFGRWDRHEFGAASEDNQGAETDGDDEATGTAE